MRIIAMLAALLPSRLPTARSWAPILTAASAVASSGSEVAPARRVTPRNPWLISNR